MLANDIFDAEIKFVMDSFFSSDIGKSQNEDSPKKEHFLDGLEIVLPDGTIQRVNMGDSPKETVQETIPLPVSNVQPEELMKTLFNFVKTKNELNSVLAGYFNKLVQRLYKRNAKKVVFVHLKDLTEKN